MIQGRAARSAAGAASALALLLACVPVTAQVVLVDTRSDYVLEGASAAVLREQLQQRLAQRTAEGGVIAHGLTRAELETRYELEPGDGSACWLEHIEVRLTIDTLVPIWRPSGRPEAGLRPRVEAMLAGLALHEAGHRDHVLETANKIDAGLRAMPQAPTCDVLRRAAQRLVSRALIKLRVNEWNYDAATQRGRHQGAVLTLEAPVRARRSASRR